MFGLPWLSIAADALFYAWSAGWLLFAYANLTGMFRQRDKRLREEGRKRERKLQFGGSCKQGPGYTSQ